MYTFIDFFAGIGGFRRGMELAGHKCVGFCEYNKLAVKTYRDMHETEGEWFADDIRSVRADVVPRADVWCFGFPCQDISVAGTGVGFAGKRSSLFFRVMRLLEDTEEKDKPTYLLIENVKNLLSVNRGYDYLRLLIAMDEGGYDAEWEVLNSVNFGVPQGRERDIIVGHLRGRTTRKVFPLRPGNEQAYALQGPCSNTITAKQGGSMGVGTYICCENQQPEQNGLIQIGQLYGTDKEPNPQAGRVYDASGIAPTLSTCQGDNRMPMIAIPVLTPTREKKRQNGRRFREQGDPMFTLTTVDQHGVMVFDKGRYRIRKLTPLECFRLQGWTDEYFYRAKYGDKALAKELAEKYPNGMPSAVVNEYKHIQKKQGTSDSQLYKEAGNGVTVTLIEAVGKEL